MQPDLSKRLGPDGQHIQKRFQRSVQRVFLRSSQLYPGKGHDIFTIQPEKRIPAFPAQAVRLHHLLQELIAALSGRKLAQPAIQIDCCLVVRNFKIHDKPAVKVYVEKNDAASDPAAEAVTEEE